MLMQISGTGANRSTTHRTTGASVTCEARMLMQISGTEANRSNTHRTTGSSVGCEAVQCAAPHPSVDYYPEWVNVAMIWTITDHWGNEGGMQELRHFVRQDGRRKMVKLGKMPDETKRNLPKLQLVEQGMHPHPGPSHGERGCGFDNSQWSDVEDEADTLPNFDELVRRQARLPSMQPSAAHSVWKTEPTRLDPNAPAFVPQNQSTPQEQVVVDGGGEDDP